MRKKYFSRWPLFKSSGTQAPPKTPELTCRVHPIRTSRSTQNRRTQKGEEEISAKQSSEVREKLGHVQYVRMHACARKQKKKRPHEHQPGEYIRRFLEHRAGGDVSLRMYESKAARLGKDHKYDKGARGSWISFHARPGDIVEFRVEMRRSCTVYLSRGKKHGAAES